MNVNYDNNNLTVSEVVKSHESRDLKNKWVEFSVLPSELIFSIFSMLEGRSLGNLMQVSTYYFKSINHLSYWKKASLKLVPNLLEHYPGLNELPEAKINWRKVYIDQATDFVDLNQWKGPHALNIMCFTGKEEKRTQKTLYLNLSSDQLSLKILKKIIRNEFQLFVNSNQISLSIFNFSIDEKESTIIKKIKVLDPVCLNPTFMDIVENDLAITISKKHPPLIPEDTLPNEWTIDCIEKPWITAAKKDVLSVKKTTPKKRDNCLMM